MKDRIEVVQGDITKLKVDAIVNAANSTLLGGGGVDGCIHRAAGPKLLEECRKLGGCPTGEARITKGYNLPAKYVIHTVGPVWHPSFAKATEGKRREEAAELLASCYRNSLSMAIRHGDIRTVAFPAISTGVYHFPKDRACRIALNTVREWLKDRRGIESVIFVCFSAADLSEYKKALTEPR